jgi:hypothetical protein
VRRRVFSKKNIDYFAKLLNGERWTDCMRSETCNYSFDCFFSVLHSGFHEAFPVRTFRRGGRGITRRGWITKGFRISSRRKRELYCISKNTADPNFHQYFRNYKMILRRTVTLAKKLFHRKLISESNNVTKTTWSVVKSSLGKITDPPACPDVIVND